MLKAQRLPRLYVILSAVLLLSAVTAYGQSAAVVGRVTDPQNAVVTSAGVTARNVDTGIERDTKTTSDGLYRLLNLQPGTYDVTVTAQNFAKAVARGVHLNVGDQRDLNFKLTLAGVTQTVEVTGQAPLIETTKTDVSTTINDADIAQLPVSAGSGNFGSGMNDFAMLALTAPGVRLDQTGNNLDLVGPGSYNDRGNLINIDGGNVIDQIVSTRDAVGASMDEIKEFQVLTNNYNAEYGQAGGLIINAITKSGTNTIHGDFHFFARGRNLSASEYFYNLGLSETACGTPPCPITGLPRAQFFKHETGFTLGGPLIKNKTFWFVSYEKLLQGSPMTLTPPSGIITVQQPDDEVMWSVKLDHQLSKNHHIMARFNAQRLTQDNLLVQIANSASPDALVAGINHDHTLNLSLISTPTPHIVNEARFFWHRFVTLTPTKSQDPGIEGADFYQHAAFCCPQGAPAPWGQNRYQGIDNLTWIHGAHTLKAGVSMSYFPYVSDFAQVALGLWDHGLGFPPTPCDPAQLAISQCDPTGAFPNPPFLFTIATGGVGFTGIPGRTFPKDNVYGWYVQDSWRIRPNLTLNYGLRWDYEAGAFKGGTIPDGKGGCFQANGIIPACSSDKNNFQPRVGIAWAPHFESGLLHTIFGDPDKSLITMSFGEMTQLAYLNISLDSLNFDGVTLLTTGVGISDPCGPAVFAVWPARPTPAQLAPCLVAGSFGRVRPISPNLHNAEVRHVNLSLQRQFGRDWALNVQYVGAFGFGQFGERDTNAPAIIPDPAHPGYFYFGDRPNPAFGPVRTQENSRTSQYNGLIVDVNRRMARHVQFHGGYTWSHTIASTEDFYGVSEPADWRNTKAERADAQLDVRHAVNLGAVFDTERLSSASGWKWLVNDWSFGISAQLESGRPYPVSTGDVPFATSTFFGIGNESVQRPNVLPDGTLSTAGIAGAFQTNYLIGPTAVTDCLAVFAAGPCPTQNTFLVPTVFPAGQAPNANGALDIYTGELVDFQQVNGNVKRNAGRTNPYYVTNLSVRRSFRIPWREGTRVELRAEFFNLFNRPNFWQFNANPNLDAMTVPPFQVCVALCDTVTPTLAPNPSFATCTSCINPINGTYVGSGGQVLKLTDLQHGRVSPNLASPIFNSLGDPGGTQIPRQIQLSIRVRF